MWVKNMTTLEEKSGEFVYPGKRLGVIEEFLSGSGTYVEDGGIYASTTGELSLDPRRREVSVIPRTRQPVIPKVGSTIVGPIISVTDKTSSIKIEQIDGKGLDNAFTGIMHVSDVSRGYVKSMTDAIKVGDVVRAKVISTKNREFHLSIRDDMFGVTEAVCTFCGHGLTLWRNVLRCSDCGDTTRRKIASDYGKESNG